MKMLEKYFKNLNGLQKSHIKHVPHAPKKIFFKVRILSTFKKGGLRQSKNENFEKIFPKSKGA